MEIKRDKPIMVVIGNPPYSTSTFESEWIMNLMEDYKKELNEKKSDLNREEWKFLRFAQHKISEFGQGITSFVINNTFIDAITHRVMRSSLLSSFNEIKILDLHGSIKGNKKCPDGSKDENIFDIQQGVCIFFGSKKTILTNKTTSSLKFNELLGKRESKYEFLLKNDILSNEWLSLAPEISEYCFFSRKDFAFSNEYYQGTKLTDIFIKYISGIQTKRDPVAITFTKKDLFQTIEDLTSLETEEFRARYKVGCDSDDWSIAAARKNVLDFQPFSEHITKITYRPFDYRWTWFTNRSRAFLGRPRYEVMRNMTYKDNLGLIAMRQIVRDECSHFGITDKVACHGTFYLGNKGQDYVFPLYLYSESDTEPELILRETRNPNFYQDFLNEITDKLGYTPSPENILYYIYAIFHSPTYRSRYAEFLKIDFPRVPLTSNSELFRQLAAYGEELVALHSMKSPKLDDLITQFVDSAGNQVVDAGHPKFSKGEVVINKKGDRFTSVPENVWNFHIGGYQVCQKWLKDRKGRTLSTEDIQHYQRIVVALQETIRLMQQIDEAIPSFPIK